MATRILFTLAAAFAICWIPACSTKSRPSEAITYTLSTSEEVEIRDLEQAANVLARHRDLTPEELVQVQKELTRIFENLVTIELRSMESVERRAAKAERRRPRVITRADARQMLLQRLGKDLALPVLTNESRSTVVFGRIDEQGVSVGKETWQTDRPVTEMPTGSTVTHPAGKKAALLP